MHNIKLRITIDDRAHTLLASMQRAAQGVSDALAPACAILGGAFGNLHRQAVEAAARHEEQQVRAKLLAELERFDRIDYAAVERRIIERMGGRPIDPCGKSLPSLSEVLDLDTMTDEQIAMLGHARKLRTSGVSSTLVVWLARNVTRTRVMGEAQATIYGANLTRAVMLGAG